MGKKKRPFYRLVVLDSRKRRDGAYLANLGYYNPFVDPPEINFHGEEIIAWLQKGATVSETVRSLLKSQGILYHYSLVRQGMSEQEIATQMALWQETSGVRTARLAQKRTEAARLAAEVKAKAEAEKATEAAAAVEAVEGDATVAEEIAREASVGDVASADAAAEPAAKDEPTQAQTSAADAADSETDAPSSDTEAAAEGADKQEES